MMHPEKKFWLITNYMKCRCPAFKPCINCKQILRSLRLNEQEQRKFNKLMATRE